VLVADDAPPSTLHGKQPFGLSLGKREQGRKQRGLARISVTAYLNLRRHMTGGISVESYPLFTVEASVKPTSDTSARRQQPLDSRELKEGSRHGNGRVKDT
jgi:hypothetical protein